MKGHPFVDVNGSGNLISSVGDVDLITCRSSIDCVLDEQGLDDFVVAIVHVVDVDVSVLDSGYGIGSGIGDQSLNDRLCSNALSGDTVVARGVEGMGEGSGNGYIRIVRRVIRHGSHPSAAAVQGAILDRDGSCSSSQTHRTFDDDVGRGFQRSILILGLCGENSNRTIGIGTCGDSVDCDICGAGNGQTVSQSRIGCRDVGQRCTIHTIEVDGTVATIGGFHIVQAKVGNARSLDTKGSRTIQREAGQTHIICRDADAITRRSGVDGGGSTARSIHGERLVDVDGLIRGDRSIQLDGITRFGSVDGGLEVHSCANSPFSGEQVLQCDGRVSKR